MLSYRSGKINFFILYGLYVQLKTQRTYVDNLYNWYFCADQYSYLVGHSQRKFLIASDEMIEITFGLMKIILLLIGFYQNYL
jgi:hypothetical protein